MQNRASRAIYVNIQLCLSIFKNLPTITNYFFLYIERYTEIERENRILLEKMTNIL